MVDSHHVTEWTVANMTRVSGLKLPLREILRHDDGCLFGRWILLYWDDYRKKGPLWIDFEIIEGVACLIEESEDGLHVGASGAGPVLFYATEERALFGLAGAKMTTIDLNAAVWTVRGFVKQDGCTQVYLPPGPLHHDDREGLRGAMGAICRVQDRCYEIYDDAASRRDEIDIEGNLR